MLFPVKDSCLASTYLLVEELKWDTRIRVLLVVAHNIIATD